MCDAPHLAMMGSMLRKYYAGRQSDNITVVEVGSRDVNPGAGAYHDVVPAAWNYIGLDILPGINVTQLVADPHDWKEMPTAVADVVISGSCLEHTEFVWKVAEEIARIMKPGAYALLCAPSIGGRHDHPIDSWRILHDGMRALAKWTGLEVIEIQTVDHPDWYDSFMVARKPEVASAA